MSKGQPDRGLPGLLAFRGALAAQDYAQRIREAAARKGGASFNTAGAHAGKHKISPTYTFKAGKVEIVQAFHKGGDLIVSYKIEGRSYSVELKPNDPRRNTERFKAWLGDECGKRVQQHRRTQARKILDRITRDDRRNQGR
jgi:hypothetical protein